MNHWFRLYNTLVDDPKVQQLPETLFKALVNLWCVASQNDGILPSANDIGYKLRIKPQKAAEYVTRLVSAGLIDNFEGIFIPHNWDHRQFQSDNSTERVQKHRNKKRNASCNGDGNVPETPNGTDRAEQIKADSKQSTPEAGVLDEAGLESERVLITLLSAVSKGLGRKPPDMKILRVWLLDGITTATISSTVTPMIKRKSDMASLVYCDSAVRDAHAKDTAPAPNLQIVSKKVFVVHGTDAWSCWERVSPGGRGWPTRERRDEDGRIQTGWDFDTEFPEGYNDFGERIAPATSEENAA